MNNRSAIEVENQRPLPLNTIQAYSQQTLHPIEIKRFMVSSNLPYKVIPNAW